MVTSQADWLKRLEAVPLRIEQLILDLPNAQLETKSNGEWSITEIVGHLRASDDILALRVYMMLARDNPPMAAYDERRWADIAGYLQADPHASLQTYALRRAELVRMLRHISADDWQRTGIHETRGPITVLDQVTKLVEHEEEHCAELEKLRVQLPHSQ